MNRKILICEIMYKSLIIYRCNANYIVFIIMNCIVIELVAEESLRNIFNCVQNQIMVKTCRQLSIALIPYHQYFYLIPYHQYLSDPISSVFLSIEDSFYPVLLIIHNQPNTFPTALFNHVVPNVSPSLTGSGGGVVGKSSA